MNKTEIKALSTEKLIEAFEYAVVEETKQTNSRGGVTKKAMEYTATLKAELLERLHKEADKQ